MVGIVLLIELTETGVKEMRGNGGDSSANRVIGNRSEWNKWQWWG